MSGRADIFRQHPGASPRYPTCRPRGAFFIGRGRQSYPASAPACLQSALELTAPCRRTACAVSRCRQTGLCRTEGARTFCHNRQYHLARASACLQASLSRVVYGIEPLLWCVVVGQLCAGLRSRGLSFAVADITRRAFALVWKPLVVETLVGCVVGHVSVGLRLRATWSWRSGACGFEARGE